MEQTKPRRSPLRTILALTAPVMIGAASLATPAHAQPPTPVQLDIDDGYTLNVNNQFKVGNVQEVMVSPDRSMVAISHRLNDMAVGNGNNNFAITVCKIQAKQCADVVPVSALPAGAYVQNLRWSAASHMSARGEMVGSLFFGASANPMALIPSTSTIDRVALPTATTPSPQVKVIEAGGSFEVIPLGDGQVNAGRILRTNPGATLTQSLIDPNVEDPKQRVICTMPIPEMATMIAPKTVMRSSSTQRASL